MNKIPKFEGFYLRLLRNINLTDEEILKYVEENNYDKIIKSHIKFVCGEVLKFKSSPYFELDDFYQIGSIGLWKAMLKYDSSKGIKFKSFAGCVIANECRMYLRNKKYSVEMSYDNYMVTDQHEVTENTILDKIEDTKADIHENLECNETKDKIKDIINNKIKYSNKEQRHAFTYLIEKRLEEDDRPQYEIGKDKGIGPEYLSRIAKRYKNILANELEDEGYNIKK